MAEGTNDSWQTVERKAFPDGRVTITVDGKVTFDGYPPNDGLPTDYLIVQGSLDTRTLFQSDAPEDFRNLSVSHTPTGDTK